MNLITTAKEKVKEMIDKGLPIKERSMITKDPETVRQMTLISQAVKVEEPYYKKNKALQTEIPTDFIEEILLGGDPSPGRILIEEYYKVLYLNNLDPQKYNFAYWEKYFGVQAKTLRNIFNYVFFPIPDEKDSNEVGRILYFQDVEYEKRRKMIGEMTSEEYAQYLENTSERPELQEVKRLDYLTHQKNSSEPRITERTVTTDYAEEDRNDDKVLINSHIIKEIDERINRLVTGQMDMLISNNLIDKDIQIQLDELKTKRVQHTISEKEKQLNLIESSDSTVELTEEELEDKVYNQKAVKEQKKNLAKEANRE